MADAVDRLRSALSDRYTIERELGSGGMATVYLAHDLKHDRKVAIKVMRPELSAILGGERFLREVQIAAKLNHPHILALYDSGRAAEVQEGSTQEFLYYVMPYVEGESLREKLNGEKQLSVDEAISITKQVGAALDYAHEQGVIHRDIKPENILVYRGEALVADFGIALALSAAGGTRLTDTGLSLGTPEYMSPEQATGERELDARSDMYSLGAITYEMLVGEPPHTGNTVQAIIAKVVSAEPQPVSRVRHSVPSNVNAAVMTALAKTPADRFGSGAEYVAALTNPAFAMATSGVVTEPVSQWSWNRLSTLAVSAAVLFAMIALWGWLRSSTTTELSAVHASILLREGEEVGSSNGKEIAISPDGSRLVYVMGLSGRSPLVIRSLNQTTGTPVPETEGASDPTFAPDGESVAYRDSESGALRVVSLDGSLPQTIVDSVRYDCLDWASDEMLYYGSMDGGISRVSASGGEPEVLTQPDSPDALISYRHVDVLPNGKGALLVLWRGDFETASIAAVEFASGVVRELVRGFHPQYATSGHLVYGQSDSRREGNLLAANFDQESLELGPSIPVIDGMSRSKGYGLSATGTLVYESSNEQRGLQPVWVERSGAEQAVDPDWQGRLYWPALSPDGNRLAIAIDGTDGRHIWIKTLDRGPLQRVTFEGRTNQPSVWSPDGQYVLFGSRPAPQGPGVWRKNVDGTGPMSLVFGVDQFVSGMTISGDGQWLVFAEGPTWGNADLYAMRLRIDSVPIPLLVTEHGEDAPALSYDGQWLAFASEETGRSEVYIRPFPNVNDGRWQASTDGATAPVWARNGRELFYVNASSELVVAEVRTEPTFVVQSRRCCFLLRTIGPLNGGTSTL
jgi:serine/threonine-protein kinase